MNPTRPTPTAASHLLEQILPKLSVVKGPDERGEYIAWCPFHADGQGKPPHRPNLSVSERGFCCHACGASGGLGKLVSKLGVTVGPGDNGIEAAYDYLDEDGEVLFQVVRMSGKRFRQRRPDGKGGWVWNLRGVRRVLYRLPELRSRAGGTVYIVEGEKDANRLHEEGLLATTNPGGAGKWGKQYVTSLQDRDVVILPDNDEPGRKHARQVARSLARVARSIKIVELPDLPEKGDVSDWLDAGHKIEELRSIVERSPLWEPPGRIRESEESPDSESGRRESQANRLVALALEEGVELFHDDVGETFARVTVGSHKEIWRCRSKDFKRWMAARLWASEQKAANSDALRAALGVIEAKARFEGPEYQLHNRVASQGSAFWYDLADCEWRAVKIEPGRWEIVTEPPVLFRRHTHQQPQVDPEPGGDLTTVLHFVNLRDASQELLLLVYLVSCLVPDIPHPVPVLHGPQGAAKTTLFRILRRLVDPSATESLSFPRDVTELVQQMSHHWMPLYDNVSGLPVWASDALCRAVSGEGFSKRELYSDDEDVIYRFRRCVGLNGINVAAHKADLLDRSIVIGLEPIPEPERRSESEFWSEFESVRPKLVGAALEILSRAMAIRSSIRLPGLPRMADFALWGCAIAEALGRPADDFLAAYGENVEVRNEEVLQASPVAACVVVLMEEREKWEGTPSELHGELEEVASRERFNTRAKGWPKAPHSMVRRLNEVRPNLEAAGIDVETGGRTGQRRSVAIRKRPRNGVTSVTSVASGSAGIPRGRSHDASKLALEVASHGASPQDPPEGEQKQDCDDSDGNDASFTVPGESDDFDSWPEERREAYEERLAIMTIDGGLSEEEARGPALECAARVLANGNGAEFEREPLPKTGDTS